MFLKNPILFGWLLLFFIVLGLHICFTCVIGACDPTDGIKEING